MFGDIIGKDYLTAAEVRERFEDLHDTRLQWACGWNMTGCLCDSEPAAFAEYEDAKQYILDTLQFEADSIECGGPDEGKAEEIESIMQDINLESGEFSVFIPEMGYWYWVARYDGDETHEDAADCDEYAAVKELMDQIEHYGADSFILDSAFVGYVQDMANDIVGNVPDWVVVDWQATADNVASDYSVVEIGEHTYYFTAY